MLPKKVGLALGGGGAKGSYQIGVYQALYEAGLTDQISIISGTSIGSINTLLIMGKENIEQMIEVWNIMDNEQLFKSGFNRYKEDGEGLYDMMPLYKQIKNSVSRNKIRSSKYQGYIVAAEMKKEKGMLAQINPRNMKIRLFNVNTFPSPHKASLASSSMPLIFGPTKIYNKCYVDGGILDNTAMTPMIDNEVDFVISIPLTKGHDYISYLDSSIHTIVNFTSFKYFFKTFILSIADSVSFKEDKKILWYQFGYYIGKEMIDYLKAMNVIDENNNFRLTKEKEYIEMPKEIEGKVYRKIEEMNK